MTMFTVKSVFALVIVVGIVTFVCLACLNQDIHQFRFPDYNGHLWWKRKIWGVVEDIFQTSMSLINFRGDDCAKCLVRDYQININPTSLCANGTRPEILLLIFSTFGNREARDAVRRTWASQANRNHGDIRYVFMFGSSSSQQDQSHLAEESEANGDILQHDFVESIRNMTIKTVTGLRWMTKHCPDVRYVIKCDTDVWLNIPKWRRLMNGPKRYLTEQSAFGHCRLYPSVIRTWFHRYSVSLSTYNQTRWPMYCRGPAYGLSRQLVREVAAVSYKVRYLPVEDAYVGVCLQHLGYHIYNPEDLVMKDLSEVRNVIAEDPCSVNQRFYVIHKVPPSDLHKLWAMSRTCR